MIALLVIWQANKIDGWADDLKVGLEREIKEFDRQIKETHRSAVAALTLEEKLEVQKQIRHLEDSEIPSGERFLRLMMRLI